MKPLVIGSRGSKLAVAQSRSIAKLIREANPGLTVDLKIIKTTGDKMTVASLVALASETKGLFVKEIEEALLCCDVDLAVHSLKDLPTDLPEGLELGLVPRREDARDAIVAIRPLQSLAELPFNGRVGTSSLRRKVQLELQRPDLEVVPVRGNVDTRLKKLRSENLDAILLAVAGLRRLALESHISHICSVDEMVPAIGQGALAVEVRSGDSRVKKILSPLADEVTRLAVTAERSFLQQMGGGCQVPIGAHVQIQEGHCSFTAFLADPAGRQVLWHSVSGEDDELPALTQSMVSYFTAQGAGEILRWPQTYE